MFALKINRVMCMVSCVGFFLVSHLSAMQITEAGMRQASRDLTAAESEKLKVYLKDRIDQLKQDSLRDPQGSQLARLEEAFKEFYRNRYDMVLKEIAALGDNPQRILNSSKLRTYMLSGKLEHTPWFLREIAGLDWFFERDAKRSRKQWPKPQDKLVYLMSLADELVMNHTKVLDATLVIDGIDSLEKHITSFLQRAPKTFKFRVSESLAKLQVLRADYTKQELQ